MKKGNTMINDIRDEAKRRNLIVEEHSKNKITVVDPTYTKSMLATNNVRVECKVSKGITYINIGFTDFHKKEFLENCSDWDLHYIHPLPILRKHRCIGRQPVQTE